MAMPHMCTCIAVCSFSLIWMAVDVNLLPSGERDDAWPGDDLMEFFQLKRLYDFSLRALDKPSAYLKGVPGDTTLYR